MFGEKLIVGKSTRKIDEKGRIYMPSFTQAEPGDDIVIEPIKVEDGYNLRLVAYMEYFNICQRLKNLQEKATSLEDFNKYNAEIERICSLLEASLTVDNQKRLGIPKETIERLNIETNQDYQCIGQGISMLITKK